MKLQIITKLVRQEPATTNPNDLHNDSRPALDNIQSEYFPKDLINPPHDRTRKPTPRDFFESFDSRVYVRYEKLEHPPIQVRRKLEPQLAALKPTIRPTPHSDYDFTFKKVQSVGITAREGGSKEHKSIPKEGNGQKEQGKTEQTDSVRKDPRKQYYLNQKTKIKLRKFHSLIAIKNDESDMKNSVPKREQPLRKNLSVMKRDESGFLRVESKGSGKTIECSYLTRREEGGNVKTESNMVSSKGEGGIEEEKERLARIRKELNEIYQMRKPSAQFKLKLY